MQYIQPGKEDSLEETEDGGQKRSPFNMFINQIQRKKSSKGKNETVQGNRFFKGFARERAKTEKETETRDPEDTAKPTDRTPENAGINTPTKEETQLPGVQIPGVQVPGVQIPGVQIPGVELSGSWWKMKQFMQNFGKKAESNHINLNNSGLTAADMKELGALLPCVPDVEEIDLSWNDLIGGSVQMLTLQIRHASKLKTLTLSNCSLTAGDTDAIGEMLQFAPYLDALDLSWNGDLGGNLSKLTQNFSHQCGLKTLKLIECNLSAADGDALARAVSKMPNLEVLDLSMNKGIGCIIKIITAELKKCTRLSVLKLHACGIQQDSIQCLSAAFPHWPYLRKLDVSCNNGAGGGFHKAAVFLTALKHLEVLDVHQCGLTGEDITALTQVVPLLSNLQVLDVSANKTVGLSIEHLFSRLRFLPKLKSVMVGNCALNKESFAALAEASVYLADLETLDLSWNKCVGGNLNLLSDTLKNATTLQSLALSSCNLLTRDLAVLASAAQAGHLGHLQQLDLAYNDTIPDEGWALFFEGLYALRNISELDVSLRPSSSRDCGAWFIHLLSSMLKLPKLKDLGMQRWALSEAETQRLDRINKESAVNIHFN
ncbi:leucine-rich repeat-containing protein 31 isoform X1 [Ascaphus truei]|uniref:leucine-rich repeat-containing protein 31 isoform X1 n=2 Tax=Ascaphus truei TaxID=8439 RepID=UPI003F5ADB63